MIRAFILMALVGLILRFPAALAQPIPHFQSVADSIGLTHPFTTQVGVGGGAAFLDYDADGDDDLYVTGGTLADRLFRNNGDGTFTDVTAQAGIVRTDSANTQGVAVADVNNDCYPEIYVTTTGGVIGDEFPIQRDLFFHNNGNGTFTEQGVSAGFLHEHYTASASFGDVNLDGYLDLYVATYVDTTGVEFDSSGNLTAFSHQCAPDYLYLNDGTGHFADAMDSLMGPAVAAADTGCGLGAVMTDYDADGDPDILVANDFGMFIEPNRLWENRLREG